MTIPLTWSQAEVFEEAEKEARLPTGAFLPHEMFLGRDFRSKTLRRLLDEMIEAELFLPDLHSTDGQGNPYYLPTDEVKAAYDLYLARLRAQELRNRK